MGIWNWEYVCNEVDALYRIANEEVCKTFIKGSRGTWKWRKPTARVPWVTTAQIVDTLVPRVMERWNSELDHALAERTIGPMDDNAASHYASSAIIDVLNASQEDVFGRWYVLDWLSIRGCVEETTKLIVGTLTSTPEANKEVE